MDLQVAEIERQEADAAVKSVADGEGALGVEEARARLQAAQKKVERLWQEHEQLKLLMEKGFITREEAAGSELANRFDELDKNHDGKLSQSELGASATTGGSSTSEYSSGPGNRYDSND